MWSKGLSGVTLNNSDFQYMYSAKIAQIYEAVDLVPGGGLGENLFLTSQNMARIATKLCQNAFRTIPDDSFFDFFRRNFQMENFVSC